MTKTTYVNWLGNTECCMDELSPSLADRVAATFCAESLDPGDALPLLWHWAFFQALTDTGRLGVDGHPELGSFLPPADDDGRPRNRMWVGGRLHFHTSLRVAETAVRESEILDIKQKHGYSGALLFVTVRHQYKQAGELAISEEQDIVYREPTAPKLSLDRPVTDAEWSETVDPDPTLLFRYSAITFNSHRIHYDWPYATEIEGYSSLVVHGPLIATLLMRAFERANPSAHVKSFSFRGLRPLITPKTFAVAGRIESPGVAKLWAANGDGPAHEAELTYTEAN